MTWEIVVGLISLFGFGVAVVTPIIRLNTSITKLNSTVEYLIKTIDRHEADIKDLKEKLK